MRGRALGATHSQRGALHRPLARSTLALAPPRGRAPVGVQGQLETENNSRGRGEERGVEGEPARMRLPIAPAKLLLAQFSDQYDCPTVSLTPAT